ncbi:hypothetical protein BDV96DRAFT_691174 [Lophiotrema nucula]|uniref:Uncharacterized protein n=1 Tax=Lophiotrema nucula TaxID=690887 RepID=A0A6A5YV13_9PLEO|nr:hypothetical protein BDV96DRAFT_691174 [Lophiotrema nucula]
MRLQSALILSVGLGVGLALPAPAQGGIQLAGLDLNSLQGLNVAEISTLLRSLAGNAAVAEAEQNAGVEQQNAKAKEGEAAAGEEVAEGEEGAENEVDVQAIFDTPVEVQGGDLKQDLQFPPSAIGSFEYEFQATTADTVTVTENKTPASAPSGFVAIEPSSFKVSLAQSKGAGLTLSKIDYIFDTASAALAGMDITQAKVGRLCADVGAFVIEETLGELEFEAEENEVTLNLNKNVTAEGEWGIFLPAAAAATALMEQMRAGAGNATAKQ